MSQFVCELVMGELGRAGAPPLEAYSHALRRAARAAAPIYGTARFGRSFRARACDPRWFAGLLVSDADLEGYSAQQLWRYADTLPAEHAEIAAAIRRHAADESRHARVFGNLALTVFPSLDCAELRSRLQAMAPDLGRELRLESGDARPLDELLSTLVLINLFEIKALILVRLLAPVALAYCPEPRRGKVAAMTRALVADELRHIGYTAAFLDRAARAGHAAFIGDAMADFQATLNITTGEDLERDVAATG